MLHVGLFGTSGVGKTTWLSTSLGTPRAPTLGIDVQSYRFDGRTVVFHDTSGRIEFDSLLESTLDDVDVAIFVYDVASRSSFADALLWMNRFLGRKKPTCALLGIPNAQRIISSVDVSLATRPWVRPGARIWFDEVDQDSFRSILRYFMKTNTKYEK